jgi:ribosomal protein S18 acetylase RimI-like enzyme
VPFPTTAKRACGQQSPNEQDAARLRNERSQRHVGEGQSGERILAMLTISQVRSEDQIAATQELLREYITWWAEVEPDDFAQAPTFLDWEKDIATLPGIFVPPAGRLLLAMQDGQPAGCVCLKRHDATTAELKRLYVRPAFRGQNIGWQLVNVLIDEARQSGYQRIVLDTHISMKKAQAIYKAIGFRVVSAPDDIPDTLKPSIVFMAYNLSANQ